MGGIGRGFFVRALTTGGVEARDADDSGTSTDGPLRIGAFMEAQDSFQPTGALREGQSANDPLPIAGCRALDERIFDDILNKILAYFCKSDSLLVGG